MDLDKLTYDSIPTYSLNRLFIRHIFKELTLNEVSCRKLDLMTLVLQYI